MWRHLGQNVREAGEAADEPFDAALFYLGAVVNGERRSAWICMQVIVSIVSGVRVSSVSECVKRVERVECVECATRTEA